MIKCIDEDIKRWWFNRQEVGWTKVSALVQHIADGVYKTEEIDYNIENYNLALDWFDSADLFDFLVHYKLVESADLSYPIIVNNHWQVVDWRHRICKAILQWKKTIKGIKILDDSIINTKKTNETN